MSAYVILFWVFASLAAGGLLIGLCYTTRVSLPSWLGAAHGMAGLFAVGAFFIVNLLHAPQAGVLAWWSLGAFAAGVVGGLLLFRVLFPGKAPIWSMMMHGSVAAVGLYLLYAVAF
ncbi:hypothetical protein I6N98_04595 [Spongiibacter nanhainus]|uniref:Uncharacterized protein n=1 Tax=Spongiibacter nanhainus TaxID=2794344 RepID=A0A7T4R2A3_9GAMM|nr:hypothetical protein [Spongiibacter nanhainus]QQD19138.1 hypothetical protein I6N98_04595 [Spongiibacter nanhainus]